MNIFQPIVSFLKLAVIELSKADDKPGLSYDDIKVIVGWVQQVNNRTKIVGEGEASKEVKLTGREKTFAVAGWVLDRYAAKIPDWTSRIITWVAFRIAKKTKLIK